MADAGFSPEGLQAAYLFINASRESLRRTRLPVEQVVDTVFLAMMKGNKSRKHSGTYEVLAAVADTQYQLACRMPAVVSAAESAKAALEEVMRRIEATRRNVTAQATPHPQGPGAG